MEFTTPCSVKTTASRLSSSDVKESDAAIGTADIAGFGGGPENVIRPTSGGLRISAIDTNGTLVKSISQEPLRT